MTWGARPYRSSRTIDLPFKSIRRNEIFHLFSALLRHPMTITQDLGLCHIGPPQLSLKSLIGVQEIDFSPGRKPHAEPQRMPGIVGEIHRHQHPAVADEPPV